jgi:hypothetical protein
MITSPPAAVQAEQLCAFLNFWTPRVDYKPWIFRQANKSHTDDFGDQVAEDEHYLILPGGHHAQRKLSLRSARTMWEIILTDNGGEQTFLEHLAQEQAEESEKKSQALKTILP